MHTAVVFIAVAALIASACAAEESATTAGGPATTMLVTSTASTASTTKVAPSAPTTTTTSTRTPVGEPALGLPTGSLLGVVGVAHDDALNLRAGPSATSEILATLEPTETAIVTTGRARLQPAAIWFEVDAADSEGWVHAGYVAFLGATDDATAEAVAAGGGVPTAPSMEELGRGVVAALSGGITASRVTMSVEPSFGDLAETTFDVVGLEDDSVLGYRLHIFADDTTAGFSLHSIERTWFCVRGVDAAGLCV